MNPKTLLIITIAAIAVGTQEIFLKRALTFYTPIQITLLRFLIAGCTMLIIDYCKGNFKKVPTKNFFFLCINGIFLILFSMLLYQTALLKLSSDVTAVIFSGNVVFVILINYIFFKIKINSGQFIGVLISLLGMGITINIFHIKSLEGVSLAIIASCMFAIYSIFTTKMQQTGISILSSTGITFCMGAIFSGIIIFFLNLLFPNDLFSLNIGELVASVNVPKILLLLISSLFNTLLAFILYFYLIKENGYIIGSIPFLLKPVLAPLFLAIFYFSFPHITVIIGGIFLLIGAIIIMRS